MEIPKVATVSSWTSVMGWLNISVFIAGDIKNGFFFAFQARAVQLTRLSHKPFDILASVFAEHGATNNNLAILVSSMCKTESPRLFHRPHSSSSVNEVRNG